MTRPLARRVILGLALLSQVSARATEVTGRVVGVIDGDTIDLLTTKFDTLRVRLSGIDAPELGQAFGRHAKVALSNLAFAHIATVEWHKRDRYGRLIAKVIVQGRDVALEMLTNGMAWHYKQFMSEQPLIDRARYAEAETQARAARRGLWADATPMPPWQYRARHSVGKGK
jgi:endonuclease YncB( thermonuclease family)